jgi:hypothetical protein
MPVEAILPIEAGHPYKAVRVRGSTNATLKTIPGYIEAPGYAQRGSQGGRAVPGRYFGQGRQPAGRGAADQIGATACRGSCA